MDSIFEQYVAKSNRSVEKVALEQGKTIAWPHFPINTKHTKNATCLIQ